MILSLDAACDESEPGAAGLKPCGTVAAHERHKRAGEPPCEACKAARVEGDRQRYLALRVGAEDRARRLGLARRARRAGPPARDSWRERAACAGCHDVMEGPFAAACAVCRGCPALWPCLRWAMSLPRTDDLDDAVVAGLTLAERNSARRSTPKGAA